MGKRKWAVITGASSGIGEEFAHQLYDMGYSLILTAQTLERLKAVKAGLLKKKRRRPDRDIRVELIAVDIGEVAGMKRLADTIESIIRPSDFTGETNLPAILINSAGFGAVGDFSDIGIEKQEAMVDVNVKGLMYLTYRVLPLMEKAGGGRILNVASSAGLFPGGPHMSVYYATKSFVVSFTNGLRQELREKHSPVRVSALCPGPVNTAFNARANVRNALPGISPKHCVKAAINGMKKDRAVIIPGLSIKAAASGAKLLPAGLILPMVSHQEKKKI